MPDNTVILEEMTEEERIAFEELRDAVNMALETARLRDEVEAGVVEEVGS